MPMFRLVSQGLLVISKAVSELMRENSFDDFDYKIGAFQVSCDGILAGHASTVLTCIHRVGSAGRNQHYCRENQTG